MTVDARRVRLAVVAIWAVFFLALWLTDSSDRFVGSRTQWVVPFGGCALALTAFLYGAALMRSRTNSRPLTLREAGGLVGLLCPVVVVLLVPNGTLGSFAASRKGSGDLFLRAAPPPPASPDDVSFLEIRIAEGDSAYAAESDIRTGLRVRLVGIPTSSGRVPPGTFELARFYVGCCVADAIPVGVPIDPAGHAQPAIVDDTWLSVTGTLKLRGKRYVVVADRIQEAHKPRHPYLNLHS